MRALLIQYIWYAVLATGYALECYQCVGNGTTCTETKVSCGPDVAYCGTWSIRESLAGVTTDIFLKNCSSLATHCNHSVESVSQNVYMAVVTKCCTTDLCNTEKFNVMVTVNSTDVANTTGCPCINSCGVTSGVPAECTQMKRNVCMNMTLNVLYGGFSGTVWQTQSCMARKDCSTTNSSTKGSGIIHNVTQYCCDAGLCSTASPSLTTSPTDKTSSVHPHCSLVVSFMAVIIILKHMF